MAKAPTHDSRDDEPPEALLAEGVGGVSGPDETPVDLNDWLGDPPDPTVFEIPEPVKLSQGQVAQGLGREALEAYLFGERVRWDAAGRRWDFRRETVNGVWSLVARVQIGPFLLAKGAITLDRMPSADGEHQLLALIESMAEQAAERQRAAHGYQRKALAEREKAAADDEKRTAREAARDRDRDREKT